MHTTKLRIAEQVMEIIKGRNYSVSAGTDIRSIMELIGQVINAKLKAEYYGPHIQAGEVNVNGLVYGVYPSVPVTENGTTASLRLPTMPVKLLKNMGLYQITKEGDVLGEFRFIPVPSGFWPLIKAGGLGVTAESLKQIMYVNEGYDVWFTENIVSKYGIKNCRVKLVVSDVRELSEFDPLPIPADMEADVVIEVSNIFRNPVPQDKVVDLASETQINGR